MSKLKRSGFKFLIENLQKLWRLRKETGKRKEKEEIAGERDE